MLRGKHISFYYLRSLTSLAWDYAYWYEFYSANQVRVNIGTLNTSVGQVLALEALNGVSAAYQYSVSPILCATSLLSAGEDVQFVLSPVFEDLWQSVEPPINTYVSTGFLYDNAIPVIRSLERVGELRKEIQNNGARFILCFFDENTLNRWDIYAWDEGAADDYEFLLRWLLSDDSLGMVFKPKKPSNLFQRIARVSDLIQRAQQTGRCKFMITDGLMGNTFPAEAAMVADVCIGKLDGSTAALEARLAGLPTVLVDAEGFRSHHFYRWGRDRVVFEDWDSLRESVERYRLAPEAYPEFGDWSPGINSLDPFRDGQGSLRIGLYIGWIYEALKKDASKQEALKMAAQQFEERWGKKQVVVAGQQ